MLLYAQFPGRDREGLWSQFSKIMLSMYTDGNSEWNLQVAEWLSSPRNLPDLSYSGGFSPSWSARADYSGRKEVGRQQSVPPCRQLYSLQLASRSFP